MSGIAKEADWEVWLTERLKVRRGAGLGRQLPSPVEGIDFFSNDYLGLARDKLLYQEVHSRLTSSKDGRRLGATGSRLLSGNASYVSQTEQALAAFFQANSALLFNAGYTANIGVLSSVVRRGDVIFYDEASHASIRDALRISFAKSYAFRHNQPEHLKALLSRHNGRHRFVVVEALYSMSGQLCPLADMLSICEEKGAYLILDEAHSTGTMGENGRGLANHAKLTKSIPIRIHTFGKAWGCQGACVVGSAPLIEYLINYARPFIYTTALPPHSVWAIRCVLEHLQANPQPIQALRARIQDFRHISAQYLPNKHTAHLGPIQYIRIQTIECALHTAQQLRQKGFAVFAILPPTVPKGHEGIRICIHSFNTTEEIQSLLYELNRLPCG